MSIDEASLTGLVAGQPITEADAEGWIPRTCFKHGPPGRIGIELEFLVHERSDPARHLAARRLQGLFDDLAGQPLYSSFTVEPGGQVELSSRPADDLTTVIAELETDLDVVAAVVAWHGARLVGAGIDPLPIPPRYLREPRYAAMETYFDRWGSAGRAMMRSTASVQVNVEAMHSRAPEGGPGMDAGPGQLRRRWDLLHAIGPVMLAAFANSPRHPVADPRWAGFANLRQGIWQTLDPARCRQPKILPTESLPEAWTRWVLDAPVLLIRRPLRAWSAPAGLSFRRWLREGAAAVPDAPRPTLSDLAYHLTTLFPPVRARGHLEVRYLDAQPGRWWRVPAAVTSAVLDDATAADAALAACEPLVGEWSRAARVGVGALDIDRAARLLIEAAAGALDRAGRPELAALADEYRDRRPVDPSDPNDPEGRPC